MNLLANLSYSLYIFPVCVRLSHTIKLEIDFFFTEAYSNYFAKILHYMPNFITSSLLEIIRIFIYFSTEGKKQGSAPLNLKDEENGDPVVAYKMVQKGGDIPIKGLQKPAPEKPSSE